MDIFGAAKELHEEEAYAFEVKVKVLGGKGVVAVFFEVVGKSRRNFEGILDIALLENLLT